MAFVPTPYSAAGAPAAPAPISPRLLLLHQLLNDPQGMQPPHQGHIQTIQDLHQAASRLAQIVANSRGQGIKPSLNKVPLPDAQPPHMMPHHMESQSSMAAHAAAIQLAQQMAARMGGGPHFPGDPGIYQIPNVPVGRQPVPNPNFVY